MAIYLQTHYTQNKHLTTETLLHHPVPIALCKLSPNENILQLPLSEQKNPSAFLFGKLRACTRRQEFSVYPEVALTGQRYLGMHYFPPLCTATSQCYFTSMAGENSKKLVQVKPILLMLMFNDYITCSEVRWSF